MIVGLLLRGFRKGLDTEAGVTLASGVSARDDLAWWCERAVLASARLSLIALTDHGETSERGGRSSSGRLAHVPERGHARKR